MNGSTDIELTGRREASTPALAKSLCKSNSKCQHDGLSQIRAASVWSLTLTVTKDKTQSANKALHSQNIGFTGISVKSVQLRSPS